MRIVVIGGTGHVGTYLVPRLAGAGHQVIVVSRGERNPYQAHGSWAKVEMILMDREREESEETFGGRIAALNAEVVIDMICFTLESARHLVEALQGKVSHFVHCGTIWIHGPSVEVPTTERQPRRPFGEYGIQKAAIEAYILEHSRRGQFPGTILHPGHIVGPGWQPLNPQGNFNPDVFSRLASGARITLPNLGMETVHHVHADDVAQAFECALNNWSSAVGESFHVVSPAALTLRGYAEKTAAYFGREAALDYLPWESFKGTVPEADAQATWDHIAHSPNCSIEKARRLIGYNPRFSSMQAVEESLDWLVRGQVILSN